LYCTLALSIALLTLEILWTCELTQITSKSAVALANSLRGLFIKSTGAMATAYIVAHRIDRTFDLTGPTQEAAVTVAFGRCFVWTRRVGQGTLAMRTTHTCFQIISRAMILARITTVIFTTLAHRCTILKIALTSTATRCASDCIDGARIFAHRTDMSGLTLTKGLTALCVNCAGSMLSTTPNAPHIAVLANIVLNTSALWSADLPAIFILVFTSSHESSRFFRKGGL
jgi:hypothetical protein